MDVLRRVRPHESVTPGRRPTTLPLAADVLGPGQPADRDGARSGHVSRREDPDFAESFGVGREAPAAPETAARSGWERLEAAGGFEPPNNGFADRRLNHLATPPCPESRGVTRRQAVRPRPFYHSVLNRVLTRRILATS
jgi:hypothetical protein